MRIILALSLLLSVGISLIFLPGCRLRSATAELRSEGGNPAPSAWLNKVKRILILGQKLTPEEEARLAGMSKTQATEFLMGHPYFADMVVDFHNYMLGTKVKDLPFQVRDGKKVYSSLDAHLVTAAQEVVRDGKYLAFLNAQQPVYDIQSGFSGFFGLTDAAPVPPPPAPSTLPAPPAPMEVELTQKQLFEKTLTSFDKALTAIKASPNTTGAQVCEVYSATRDGLFIYTRARGFNANANEFANQLFPMKSLYCGEFGDSFPEGEKKVKPELIASMQKIYSELKKLTFPETDKEGGDDEGGKAFASVMDVQSFDLTIAGVAFRQPLFTNWIWGRATNSSTNYNRRRAAYILRTFFCDDLVPEINESGQPVVMTPAMITEHKGVNTHATDPGCFSCHYKLDPMGSFFRFRGARGDNFQGQKFLSFDDGASRSLKEYIEDGWGMKGRIAVTAGYVRDPDKPRRNDIFPDTPGRDPLEDLSMVLQKAPEVRQCITRRLVDYMIDKNQSYDLEWLENLSVELDSESTGRGFKNIVAKVALSNAFDEKPRLDPGKCYDFVTPPDASTPDDGQPPCAVASLIRTHCLSCHGAEGAAGGGLRLGKWNPQSKNFEHLKPQGPMKRQETFAMIYDRLTTADKNRRMPKQKISDVQAKQLKDWFAQQVRGTARP